MPHIYERGICAEHLFYSILLFILLIAAFFVNVIYRILCIPQIVQGFFTFFHFLSTYYAREKMSRGRYCKNAFDSARFLFMASRHCITPIEKEPARDCISLPNIVLAYTAQ